MDPRPRRPSLVPDLYHLLRTSTTPSPHNNAPQTEILGTYTDVDSLKAAASQRLLKHEGHARDDFALYVENVGQEHWPYAYHTLVYAQKKSPDGGGDEDDREGETIEISLSMTPNSLGVRSRREGGSVDGSSGAGLGRVEEDLFYVLLVTKTTASGKPETDVRGAYLSRQAALEAARAELGHGDEGDRGSFARYQEVPRAELGDEEEHGEVVVVRATGREGEEYVVCVVGES